MSEHLLFYIFLGETESHLFTLGLQDVEAHISDDALLAFQFPPGDAIFIKSRLLYIIHVVVFQRHHIVGLDLCRLIILVPGEL